MSKFIFIAVLGLAFSGVCVAQTPKVATPPPVQAKPQTITLKPEDALTMRNAQYELSKKVLTLRQLEEQFTEFQKNYAQISTDAQKASDTVNSLAKTALKNSGYDPDKFDLNLDTLAVTPKIEAKPETKPETKPEVPTKDTKKP